jgi:hypothetical protein
MADIKSVTYEDAIALTASDSANVGPYAALYTGSGGNITITTIGGTKTLLAGTAAGIIIPIAFTRLWATGTSPTNVCGLVALPYKPSLNPGTGTVI